jgi:hypothetical protein
MKINRVCQPFENIFPIARFFRKLSIDSSFSHWANNAICLTKIREDEKMGDPSVIEVIHSACISPVMCLDVGGNKIALKAEMYDVLTRW